MPSSTKITHPGRAPLHGKTAYPYGFAFQHAVSAAIGAIRDKTKLPRSHELVLRALLTYINAKTGIGAVGYRQLVEELRMSQDDVRGHLNALIANGVVVVVKAAAPCQARELRIDLSALHKLAGGSTRPVYGKYQAEARTDPVGAWDDDEARTDPVGAWSAPHAPVGAGVHAPIGTGVHAPTQSVQNDVRGNDGGDFRNSGQRENFPSGSFLMSAPPDVSLPTPESGRGSAARRGKGRVAAELAPSATSDPRPTTSNPCSSPPVEARPADLPPASAVRYIRYLMRCGECDHDQLVSRLCSEPWLGQMLSEAEADAVVTAAMAEAGQ